MQHRGNGTTHRLVVTGSNGAPSGAAEQRGKAFSRIDSETGRLRWAATPLSAPNATPSYFWTDAVAAQAAWELDFWGKFRRGVESADGAYLASIASYDNVLVSLLGDVTATYIGIRTTEQLIAIARASVRRQEKALSIAKAKFQGGASELDVFQATNVLEQTRASIPQLTIQLQQGENALCVLLGVPPQSLGMVLSRSVGRIPSPPRTVVVGIPAGLLRRRPDVRAAELAALAQSAQIGIAETQLCFRRLARLSRQRQVFPVLRISGQQFDRPNGDCRKWKRRRG